MKSPLQAMSFSCGIVEDQTLFRNMLANLITKRCCARVVLELGSLVEARCATRRLQCLDLLVLDIRLPDGNSLDFVSEIRLEKIGIPVLLLSAVCDDFVIHQVSHTSVQGFVHKDEGTDILVTAVQAVVGGGSYYSARFVEGRRKLAQSPEAFCKILSEREQKLLKLLGAGFSDAEASSVLGLSGETVHTHRRNIMKKLGVHTGQDLQAFALQHGFTTTPELRCHANRS